MLPRRCGRHIVRSDFFAKVTSHSFCRSSFPNRTRYRWASIRFYILIGASFFVNASRVVADGISFATAFSYLKQTPSLIHFVAPPSPAKPTALRGPQIQAAHRLRHAFLQKLPVRAFRCVAFSEKGRAAPSLLACKRARTASAYQPFSGHEGSALTGNIRKYLFIVLRHVGASFVSLAPIFLYKNQSARTPQLLLCAKSHARLASSVVNALTSPR